jgi:uncharacterized protein YukE
MLPSSPIDLGNYQGRRVLLVPVADISLPENLAGPAWRPGARNQHGYDYDDLASTTRHFEQRILPEILRGVPLDELAARGSAHHPDGSVDWSSNSALISSFFGANGITVGWDGSRPDVPNGRHRLQIIRDLGISHVPVVVHGSSLPKGIMPLVLASYPSRNASDERNSNGGGFMSEQTRVTPDELEDFARKFLARALRIEDRLLSIRDGLRALGRTFTDQDFEHFQGNFERSSRSLSEFTEFCSVEAERMKLMAEDARRKQQVAKGGA